MASSDAVEPQALFTWNDHGANISLYEALACPKYTNPYTLDQLCYANGISNRIKQLRVLSISQPTPSPLAFKYIFCFIQTESMNVEYSTKRNPAIDRRRAIKSVLE